MYSFSWAVLALQCKTRPKMHSIECVRHTIQLMRGEDDGVGVLLWINIENSCVHTLSQPNESPYPSQSSEYLAVHSVYANERKTIRNCSGSMANGCDGKEEKHICVTGKANWINTLQERHRRELIDNWLSCVKSNWIRTSTFASLRKTVSSAKWLFNNEINPSNLSPDSHASLNTNKAPPSDFFFHSKLFPFRSNLEDPRGILTFEERTGYSHWTATSSQTGFERGKLGEMGGHQA